MSWREIEHTADWAIEVVAPDLTSLFLEAASGLYGLAGCERSEGVATTSFEVDGPDPETVLVAFLDELLYFLDVHHEAFDELELAFDGELLRVQAKGQPVTRIVKTIKAVTFHDLAIETTPAGLTATIVFDV